MDTETKAKIKRLLFKETSPMWLFLFELIILILVIIVAVYSMIYWIPEQKLHAECTRYLYNLTQLIPNLPN